MKLPSLRTVVRSSLVAPLTMLAVLPASACIMPSEADALESILRSTDAVDGEITIVNQDGRRVTLKISTEDAAETEGSETDTSGPDSPSNEQVGKDGGAGSDGSPCDDLDETTLLPRLESIEDVFGTLGKWEKAVVLREEGLTWDHIARELGFGPDKMHIRLLDIAEESVYAAKHAGCLTLDRATELLNQFNQTANLISRVTNLNSVVTNLTSVFVD